MESWQVWQVTLPPGMKSEPSTVFLKPVETGVRVPALWFCPFQLCESPPVPGARPVPFMYTLLDGEPADLLWASPAALWQARQKLV
jgi:hypothetical protein